MLIVAVLDSETELHGSADRKVIYGAVCEVEHVAATAVTLLAAADPGDPNDPANWPLYIRLAPHVLAIGPLGDDHPDSRRLILAVVTSAEYFGQ